MTTGTLNTPRPPVRRTQEVQSNMTSINQTSNPPYADPAHTDQPDLTPGARAICVDCDGLLIAKCGDILQWHWAHEATDTNCVGSDGETAWHRTWKLWAENHGAQTEITDGPHRADIIWPDGHIYELQSNYLSPADIDARERHWGTHLTWIYRITPNRSSRLTNIGDGWFKWRQPALSMTRHNRPVIWHINDRLFNVTIKFENGDVQIRVGRGEPDQYGPVLYGSQPAPFDLNDPLTALRRLQATP